MSHLKALKFGKAPEVVQVSPEQHRRNRFMAKIDEQLSLAANPKFSVQRLRSRTDSNGVKHREVVDVTPRAWWIGVSDGSYVLVLRYGARKLSLGRGKEAILCSDMAGVVAALEAVRAATEAGELDAMLEEVSKRRG